MANSLERIYEGMFLVDSAVATSDWDGVISVINTIFERAQAEVINLRKWDERRLCYDVKGHKRGTYILSYFRADPEVIRNIERDVQLNETILRVLILRADHLTQEEIEATTPAMSVEQEAPAEAPAVPVEASAVPAEVAAVPAVEPELEIAQPEAAVVAAEVSEEIVPVADEEVAAEPQEAPVEDALATDEEDSAKPN